MVCKGYVGLSGTFKTRSCCPAECSADCSTNIFSASKVFGGRLKGGSWMRLQPM